MPDTITADPHDSRTCVRESQTLTPRQADTLRAIFAHLEEDGRLPTLDDLARRLGVGRAAPHWHLKALAEMGWIDYGFQLGITAVRGLRLVPVLDGSPDAIRLREVLDAHR